METKTMQTKTMQFKEIVMKRYATKKFDGKTLPQEKVDELFDIIRMSASSFGLQPWKIKVVTDQKTKEALTPLAWNQAQVTTCSHLLVICADSDIKGVIALMEKTMLAQGTPPENVKGFVDMVSGFEQKMSEDQRKAWAQKQCYIALGNALNGAKSLGFDSCPMEGFDSAGFAKALNLPAHLVPTVLCPIGYAADSTPKMKTRFSKEEIFF